MRTLAPNRKGYAVMSPDLQGTSIEADSIDNIKQYCTKDYVIAERIPKVIGFYVSVKFLSYYKIVELRRSSWSNVLWLHWMCGYEYGHKTGKIVYRSEA